VTSFAAVAGSPVSTGDPAAISFRDVSKRFGLTTALSEFSLDIQTGEFLVIVGPSGCGKTTALRIVAGLEHPSEGRVFLGSNDVTEVRGRDRDLAMVFQSYALYPHLSVEDNIAFGLRQRHFPRGEVDRRVNEVARMLELGELRKRKPGQLSGGQRQRVALGRAIARETNVLLMDEPLSNLDAQLRQRARMELSELHQRLGSTVLYVTHDQVEAMTMGGRVAVMRHGVLQQCDTPQHIYNRPANQFVAGFIGSPPMNLLPATVAQVGGELEIAFGSFRQRSSANASFLGRNGGAPQVTFGIRPEQFLPEPGPAGTGGLDGVVRIVEPLGSDQFVTIECDAETRVTARLRPDISIRIGDHLGLFTTLHGTHLFDRETEDRLTTIETTESSDEHFLRPKALHAI
jgi:multiple sugar transport system ATP-binding protein